MYIVIERWTHTWCFVLLLILFSSPLIAKESYYGEVEGGVEIRIEDDGAGVIYLQVFSVDRQGHCQSLLQPLRMEPIAESDHSYEAVGFVHGVSVPIQLSLPGDGAILKWMQPAQLKLANGSSLQIAGNHRLLTVAERRAAAERYFKLADQGLNEAYRELRGRLTTEGFAELRSNQRRWLKYRDHYIADDDDTAVNGPGSIPFMQVQTMRTLQRTAFLLALTKPLSGGHISGRYSDGIDWELRINEVSLSGWHLFFIFNYRVHDPQGPEWPEPILISGCALPTGNGHWWAITGKGNNINPERDADSVLLLEPADDSESVVVSLSAQAPFHTRLYRMAELTPAEEPIRKILLRMPTRIFDNTTEGLSEEDKTQLLLTGASGSFQLQELGINFVQVRYPGGEVDLRRFPGADGRAVIAVATTNGRARSFELWLLSTASDIPVPWPQKLALPQLGVSDFFTQPKAIATATEGFLDFSLRKDLEEIHVAWIGSADGPETDFAVDLLWDGYGFGVVRSARME